MQIYKEYLDPELFSQFSQCKVDPSIPDSVMMQGINAETGQRLLGFPYATESIRVNRSKLKRFLETGVDIRWDQRFTHYELENNGVVAHFENGTIEKGTILVGADGLNSVVRKQLLPLAEMNQIPVALLGLTRSLTMDEVRPLKAIAPTHFLAMNFTTKQACFVSMQGQKDGKYDYFFALTEILGGEEVVSKCREVEKDISEGGRGETKIPQAKYHSQDSKDLLANFKASVKSSSEWWKPLREILLSIPDDTDVKALHIRDWCPTEWHHNGRVVILGDALHPMTMFRGEGANTAIADARNLTAALMAVTKDEDLDTQLQSYMQDVVKRGTDRVLASRYQAFYTHLVDQNDISHGEVVKID